MRGSDPKDITRSYFRCQTRVFVLNGQWYFTTREGERGPFRSEQRAGAELERYIAECTQLKHFQKVREAEAMGSLRKKSQLSDLAILPMEETPYTHSNGGVALDTEN